MAVDPPTGAGDGSGERGPGGDPPRGSFREVDAWAVVSYLIGGVLVWGAVGWLVDAWLGTRGFVAGGIVLGAAGGVALVWLRYSKP